MFYPQEFIYKTIEIAQKAADAIMEIKKSDLEIEKKIDESPVTRADRAASDIICSGLPELMPVPIICEETASIPYHERCNAEHLWIVDPLDGTKEYINENNDFTVNIGLVKRFGRIYSPVFGVVVVPAENNKTYYGVRGRGAFIVDKDGEHKIQCRLSEVPPVIVASKSHINEETREYLSQYPDSEQLSIGSSLKFLLVAEGQADLYPRLGTTMEWDTCAAHAIVNAAGGVVLQKDTAVELSYNKEDLRNQHFVCCR